MALNQLPGGGGATSGICRSKRVPTTAYIPRPIHKVGGTRRRPVVKQKNVRGGGVCTVRAPMNGGSHPGI